jgi:hypothetical protein
MFKHPYDNIVINKEGIIFRCGLCDMHVPHSTLMRGRGSTAICQQGQELKKKRVATKVSQCSSEVVFTVRDSVLDLVREFIYLCRLLSSMDEDWSDVVNNLVKARQRWSYISRMLLREGSNPIIVAMFYKAVAQTVLLFKTWVLTKLESFHQLIAGWLTGRAPVYLRREEQWQYSSFRDAMKVDGLLPINEYIARRRKKLAEFVVTRPLGAVCREMKERGVADDCQF